MIRRYFARMNYQRFIKFCVVGGIGTLIYMLMTWLLTEFAGLWYMVSLAIATVVATIWNYNMNVRWTFK